MIKKYSYGNLTWIDLKKPKVQEIRNIIADYGLNDVVGQELLSPTLRSKVDTYENFAYLVFHIPSTSKISGIQELDIVLGHDFIITTRYEEIDFLLDFSKSFEVESMVKKSHRIDSVGYLLSHMLEMMYHSLSEKLDRIEDDILEIERFIFEGKERQMVRELSQAARILLTFKTATDNHDSLLESFQVVGTKMYGDQLRHKICGIQGEFKRVRNSITSKRDIVIELRETNDSLLNSKQNEIMKVFTILAFMTFPLALIIDILSIPSSYNPIFGNSNDFWIIVGTTFAILGSMLFYFKRKGWL